MIRSHCRSGATRHLAGLASAVALAWPHGGATAWCVRGLGLLAASLFVLRLSLFVVDDEARDA